LHEFNARQTRIQPVSDLHRLRSQRVQGALAVLRAVHDTPQSSRAEVAQRLGLSTSSMTEIAARLRASSLVAEEPASGAGGRGRPSLSIRPHPAGPVALAVELRHADWRVAAVELGLNRVASLTGRHRQQRASVFAAVRRALGQLHGDLGSRVQAVSVSVPATVVGREIVQAATLGWTNVDAAEAVPPELLDRPLLVGNDATLAGLAEARRGTARSTRVALYLTVEVGVGGVLLVDGKTALGATGAGGEFGHLPFGDPRRRCPCGARGCWDLEVDGRAMARTLRRSPKDDPRGFAERTIEAALRGPGRERAAVEAAAAAFGRGTGGLVNALDPNLVVVGGIGPRLLEAAPEPLAEAYAAALMRYRRATPPSIEAAALGDEGALLGAAEAAFDEILSPDGLAAWTTLQTS
jgi:predicted NBD/HSP70 family sugar kinase